MTASDPPPLTGAEFEALCKLLWGEDGWQSQAARFLGVSVRNVQYFAAEPPASFKVVPEGVRKELLSEVARRNRDPKEAGRMRRWVGRHETQLIALRGALDVT